MKLIHLVRHAQAAHNVADDWSIPDAVLTTLGRSQAIKLLSHRTNLNTSADLLVCSPLRRTMSTMLLGFNPLLNRLSADKVILLPLCQEIHALPSDTGSPASKLLAEPEFFSLTTHLNGLKENWNEKEGDYASDLVSLEKRARLMRIWLRDRSETEIVVVSHGGFLRMMTQQPKGLNPFENAEVRTYTFAEDSDFDAVIIPVVESSI